MKKILFLIIALLLVTTVSASLKETVQQEVSATDTTELAKIKFFLPLRLKITDTLTNEQVYIEIKKDSNIYFPDFINKPDIEIKTSEFTLIELLRAEDVDESILDQIEISTNSVKGSLTTEFMEDLFNVKLVKKKSFSDKTIGALIKPITFFINKGK